MVQRNSYFHDKMRSAAKLLGLGATGKFNGDALDGFDQGGIKFNVSGDVVRGLVHVNFGQPVEYFSMSPDQVDALIVDLERAKMRACADPDADDEY